MKEFIKDNGKMIFKMEKELCKNQVNLNKEVFGKKEKRFNQKIDIKFLIFYYIRKYFFKYI